MGILTIILLGLGVGYYFFPSVNLGFSWHEREKSMNNSSTYFVNKSMDVTEKPYIDLYNSELYGLKYIFSDGYSGFNSYLIARDNFFSLDPINKDALVENVVLANNVNLDIFTSKLRDSISNAIYMFNILIVNNEFQTIIGGNTIALIILIFCIVFPNFFYNYYFYNCISRTELNIYYFRMKRRKKKEERKKIKNKCTDCTNKKWLKELEKISKSEFLEIYFFAGEYDFLKKDFNAEENLMFHKSIKMFLKIGWIFILSAIILIICDALIVINREMFIGPLFIVGCILSTPIIMFYIFLIIVYGHQNFWFKATTDFVNDWPFHAKLLWNDDYITTSELFPNSIIDFSIERSNSLPNNVKYSIPLSWFTQNSPDFNTKEWLLGIRQKYYIRLIG